MRICHISDPHGAKGHTKLEIPECDVLVCSGDIGGRTNLLELTEFLIWMEKQPARKKILVAGNHDIIMDYAWVKRQDDVLNLIANQQHLEALRIIPNYDVVYLNNKDYVFEGVKFYGSPYSPSFHREHWAFNADRGEEISKIWGRIPSDTHVLITHGPPFGVMDMVDLAGRTAWHIDGHVGCQDLMGVIKKRLTQLKLHCFGHIHDNYGVLLQPISNSRKVLFSNGAVLTNEYTQLITKPLIINI